MILTAEEVQRLLHHLHGVHYLIGRLLYGTGMRIMEAMRLRVKDIDFARREIAIRDGKGAKDRMTMLPNGLAQPLKLHLIEVANTHRIDLAEGDILMLLNQTIDLIQQIQAAVGHVLDKRVIWEQNSPVLTDGVLTKRNASAHNE